MVRSKQAQFVAIVEDDAGLRAAISNLLASVGIRARGFRSAEQFLKARAAARAACVVLDIQLPGMSGRELYDRLQARERRRPTILISGGVADGPQTRAGGSRKKGTIFLRKPFSDGAFLGAIRRALRHGVHTAGSRPGRRSRQARQK